MPPKSTSMREYYKRFWGTFRKDFVAATRGRVMMGALFVIGILICQIIFGIIRSGEIHARVLSIAWPYATVLVALFVWHLVRTPYKLDEGRGEREKELETALAAEKAKNKFPLIDVVINEVHFVPTARGGNVFVLATLHNLTDVITRIVGYDLQLEVGGTRYVGELAELAGWVIDPKKPLQQPEALSSLAEREPLRRGLSEQGWLRFSFRDGPRWPSIYEQIDEDSGCGGWDTSGATGVILTVKDAFNTSHQGSVTSPWKCSGKVGFPPFEGSQEQ